MAMITEQDKKDDFFVVKRIIILLCSWALILLVAAFFFVTCFGVVLSSQSVGPETADSYIVMLLSTLFFSFLWLALRPYRQKLFIKYARLALALGTTLLIIINCLFAITYLVGVQHQGSSLEACSTLADKLNSVRSATYPIATDQGTGTAFAVSSDGLLLTANHVIDGAQRVYVNFVSGEIPVVVQAVAPEYDLALLKIDQPTPDYVHLTGRYDVADQLYAVGYPGNTFQAGQASVSSGILSRILSPGDMKLNSESAPAGLELVQTDAALNPGNSGGPLFNRCGVVGVVDAKSDRLGLQKYGVVSEEGISFAVSSKSAASRFGLPIQNN